MTAEAGLADQPYAELLETHSAVVFFVGNRAYKLKKPVDLGFLDFSTPGAREAACVRETELNRRFAPDVYLGTAEVSDSGGGPCEHLVVMRRMPASRRLSALVRARMPVEQALRQVARILAVQHAASPRSPEIAEQGSRDALLDRWQANVSQARELTESPLDPAAIDSVQQLSERFLAAREPLFAARAAAGRIVDGHGDLLAGDIFCLDDGPKILDCLEFDDRLRWLDGLDDAAFLAMDLERLGAADLAEMFTGAYAEFSADPAPVSLRHHYVAYRAFVRAKVAAIRARQGDPGSAAKARALAEITLRHLRAGAVTLVMIGGLPGTGKSVLAAGLADQLGCTILSSDRIRKELAGISPEEPAPAAYEAGIYTPAWTSRTYAELLHRASGLLACGESVIVDASWTAPRRRAAAAAVAETAAADLVRLRCTVPADVAAKRMASRTHDASDASSEIAARMAADLRPWPEAVDIDTSNGSLEQALHLIRPHGPEHVWRTGRPYMLPS